MVDTYDLLVVGGGPAGLTAAIQAARDGLHIGVVTDEAPGGLLRAAHRLSNYPGFAGGITGEHLADLLANQMAEFGVSPLRGHVETIRAESAGFATRLNGTVVESRTVLLATGTTPLLPLPFTTTPDVAEMIHRDVRTMSADLIDRRIVVVGGGEAAIDSALTVAARGARATVLCRGQDPKAPPWLVNRALERGVVIRREGHVMEVQRVQNELRLLVKSGDADAEVIAHGLLVAIGRQPNRSLFDELCPGTTLPTDVRTVRPGLFVAGDLIRGHDRFAAIAAGDGQRAARAALAFLRGSQS